MSPKTTRKRQLQFVGRVCIKKDMEHLVLTDTNERDGGRPMEICINSLSSWTYGKQWAATAS